MALSVLFIFFSFTKMSNQNNLVGNDNQAVSNSRQLLLSFSTNIVGPTSHRHDKSLETFSFD